MGLGLVGAGLPRTGTMSLKLALEELTGGSCYHMHEVFQRPGHAGLWSRVFDGDLSLFDEIFDGFTCAVDWPVAAAWQEIALHYPDAPVLLSRRSSASVWWQSADQTVWEVMRGPRTAASDEWWEMNDRILERFSPAWDDEAAAKDAYQRHLEQVRASISHDRLFEYQPGDGWEPLCAALRLPVPDLAFPHVNTTEDFMQRRRESGSSGDT